MLFQKNNKKIWKSHCIKEYYLINAKIIIECENNHFANLYIKTDLSKNDQWMRKLLCERFWGSSTYLVLTKYYLSKSIRISKRKRQC